MVSFNAKTLHVWSKGEVKTDAPTSKEKVRDTKDSDDSILMSLAQQMLATTDRGGTWHYPCGKNW